MHTTFVRALAAAAILVVIVSIQVPAHGQITSACLVPPKPTLASSGVVNAASFQAGVSPGAWISIFGQNLGSYKRALVAADLGANLIPTTIGGVSVQINGKPAFTQYVSSTQINVLAPADTSTGTVQVTVTNAGVTSDPISVPMQQIQPGLFQSQNYAAAVRSDGVILTATQAAKSGDVIQLYGTGFGPTNPAVTPGTVFQGSYPLITPPTVTIGGVAAIVSYAGLVTPGLYQINLTVPTLTSANHELLVTVGGLRTQSGVLLKVQN